MQPFSLVLFSLSRSGNKFTFKLLKPITILFSSINLSQSGYFQVRENFRKKLYWPTTWNALRCVNTFIFRKGQRKKRDPSWATYLSFGVRFGDICKLKFACFATWDNIWKILNFLKINYVLESRHSFSILHDCFCIQFLFYEGFRGNLRRLVIYATTYKRYLNLVKFYFGKCFLRRCDLI